MALHELLEEMIRIFSAKADEKKLKLVLDIDPQLPHFLILDEIRLRQILFNLMGNALKFTDKGQVKLSASSILNEADDSKVDMVISVADTGVGIPDSALKSIFEAFTQQDKQDTRKYGGTGLGLSISRKLVSMMDGTIEVESSFGEGATFSVYFTGVSISASEGKNRLKNAELEKIKFAPAKVLVVDDIEVNRELISEIFSNQPFEIIQAENGQEAVRLAHEHHPQLVITDIRMPVMDGFEELRQLREAPDTQHIPVVALTASVMEHEIYKLEESGFNGYLRKPARLDNIYKELMKVLPYQLEQPTPAETFAAETDSPDGPDLNGLPHLLEACRANSATFSACSSKTRK